MFTTWPSVPVSRIRRDESADAVDDPPEVDVEDCVPRFEGEFPARSAVHDASVVHRDVESAKAIHRMEASFLDRLRIADIEPDGINLGTGRSDLRSGRVDRGGVDVG